MTAAPLSTHATRDGLRRFGSSASRVLAIKAFHFSAVAGVFVFILILIAGVFS